jgi:hypothetical protein
MRASRWTRQSRVVICARANHYTGPNGTEHKPRCREDGQSDLLVCDQEVAAGRRTPDTAPWCEGEFKLSGRVIPVETDSLTEAVADAVEAIWNWRPPRRCRLCGVEGRSESDDALVARTGRVLNRVLNRLFVREARVPRKPSVRGCDRRRVYPRRSVLSQGRYEWKRERVNSFSPAAANARSCMPHSPQLTIVQNTAGELAIRQHRRMK